MPKFPKDTYVQFKASANEQWRGHAGCVVGYDARRKFPYKLSILPTADMKGLTCTVRCREDQIELFDGV